MINLLHGDCLEQMKTLEDNSVDAVVTDPPYGLSFMGKKWDIDVPATEVWAEAIRVLKPGGHLISFGGTRTYHRMAVAIEDAGFEIRDMVSWIYGSGFPKSLNIGKAVDKLQGNEREEVDKVFPDGSKPRKTQHVDFYTEQEGKRGGATYTKGNSPYEGWGTALKPAQEPCVLARKPLSEKTVAANVLKWGTGGLNIDASRVPANEELGRNNNARTDGTSYVVQKETMRIDNSGGKRFPANIIHDGSDEVLEVFPETKSGKVMPHHKSTTPNGNGNTHGKMNGLSSERGFGDSGSAARFFYCAKSSKAERNKGCGGLEEKENNSYGDFKGTPEHAPKLNVKKHNHHPTVKPIALMEYMVKLITPPGGTVLDPYMGSGSTGMAAKNLGHDFIGIEMDAEYLEIAKARINS